MSIIQSIYLKFLWLKKTYPFHWAHKPLCATYREDLLTIQSLYICRSCFFGYLGIMTGLLFSIVPHPFHLKQSAILAAITWLVILVVSLPKFYKKFSRQLRDLIRFSTGFTLVQIVFMFLHGQFILPLICCAVSSIVWTIYYKQRARRKINLCHSCQEYSHENVCSGYKKQQLMIRSYEEEATAYILRTGYIPEILKK